MRFVGQSLLDPRSWCYTCAMQLRFSAHVLIVLACATLVQAAPPVELEVATERGVQITAPQEWLQLLAAIGIDRVRIRALRSGDEPQVVDRGAAGRPSYHVVGILSARNQLRLPGGTFSRGDRTRLKDYFERLAADGAESLTAPRGRYGLTEKELQAALADLAQPINFETKGQPLRAVVDRFQSSDATKLVVDPDATRVIQAAAAVADEVKGLSTGTGLAIVLRSNGLVFRPEKARGQPVVYRIAMADADSLVQSTLGKTSGDDATLVTNWPIGWELQDAPGNVAPSLSEVLNAEIDGYSLDEALAAIGLRLKVPLYLDHAALAARHIDPAAVQVRLARTRTSYKRVIDLVLSQARLGSELRVDEAGTPFLWITR